MQLIVRRPTGSDVVWVCAYEEAPTAMALQSVRTAVMNRQTVRVSLFFFWFSRLNYMFYAYILLYISVELVCGLCKIIINTAFISC